jgi:hypothetical protein
MANCARPGRACGQNGTAAAMVAPTAVRTMAASTFVRLSVLLLPMGT